MSGCSTHDDGITALPPRYAARRITGGPSIHRARGKSRKLRSPCNSRAVNAHRPGLAIAVAAVACTGFPDPTLTPPSNPADYSAVIDRNGVLVAIPKPIDTSSPAFKQAATACNFSPVN